MSKFDGGNFYRKEENQKIDFGSLHFQTEFKLHRPQGHTDGNLRSESLQKSHAAQQLDDLSTTRTCEKSLLLKQHTGGQKAATGTEHKEWNITSSDYTEHKAPRGKPRRAETKERRGS